MQFERSLHALTLIFFFQTLLSLYLGSFSNHYCIIVNSSHVHPNSHCVLNNFKESHIVKMIVFIVLHEKVACCICNPLWRLWKLSPFYFIHSYWRLSLGEFLVLNILTARSNKLVVFHCMLTLLVLNCF